GRWSGSGRRRRPQPAGRGAAPGPAGSAPPPRRRKHQGPGCRDLPLSPPFPRVEAEDSNHGTHRTRKGRQKEEEAEGKGTSYICPVLSLFRVFLCLPWLNVFILPPSGAELLQRPLDRVDVQKDHGGAVDLAVQRNVGANAQRIPVAFPVLDLPLPG